MLVSAIENDRSEAPLVLSIVCLQSGGSILSAPATGIILVNAPESTSVLTTLLAICRTTMGTVGPCEKASPLLGVCLLHPTRACPPDLTHSNAHSVQIGSLSSLVASVAPQHAVHVLIRSHPHSLPPNGFLRSASSVLATILATSSRCLTLRSCNLCPVAALV